MMRKITIIFALVAMLFAFSGCGKNKGTNPGTDPEELGNDFAGIYELSVDYDVYVDGELTEESNSMSGILKIMPSSRTTVVVEGIMQFNGSETMLYETTGTIGNDNVLRLNPSTYDQDTVPISVFYNDIEYA
ncbi:MAG: hypothetical protein MJ002_04460 [Paludibacteraceae bacterium]|nr:hypothetical protein [Paludibacteraceae bacterium]